MAEELQIPQLLERLKGFSIVERVILAHDGTVVTLLAMLFGQPITVRVVQQREEPDAMTPWGHRGPAFLRTVDLMAGQRTVAVANSIIPFHGNHEWVLDLVRKREMGIGAITAHLGIPTIRLPRGVGRRGGCFWREYDMRGQCVAFAIEERFPTPIYRELMCPQEAIPEAV